MIVLFDSNIWIKHLGLRTGPAAAVRHYLAHQPAKIALPEVVRLEVEKNLTRNLVETVEKMRGAYEDLLTAFGTFPALDLPNEHVVKNKVANVFASLGVHMEVLEIPFSLESARSSFMKCVLSEPPSGPGNQQFKDGVIWSDALKLADTDAVSLVTEDKAFFHERNPALGLAKNLVQEASRAKNSLDIYYGLTNFLEQISAPVPLDVDSLVAAFLRHSGASVASTLTQHGFTLGPRTSDEIRKFATENPSEIFFTFSIQLQCYDTTASGRKNAFLNLKGDGIFDRSNNTFKNLRNFGEGLVFQLADGTIGRVQNQVIHVGQFGNSRTTQYSPRYELKEKSATGNSRAE